MTKLTTLPPEIRNIIYDLLLVSDMSFWIVSARKKHMVKNQEKHTYFASLLLVNKQINAEAKAIFFSHNKFVIGNGKWGSTTEVNLHGLKQFTCRVPKDCIALIRRVDIDIFTTKYMRTFPYAVGNYHIRKEDVYQVRSMCRKLLKYFKGVESVSIAACELVSYSGDRYSYAPGVDLAGEFGAMARTVQELLSLPTLKQLHFHAESARNMNLFAKAVLKGKTEAKGVMIELVKEDGSSVPF